jgi:hypothetical protein
MTKHNTLIQQLQKAFQKEHVIFNESTNAFITIGIEIINKGTIEETQKILLKKIQNEGIVITNDIALEIFFSLLENEHPDVRFHAVSALGNTPSKNKKEIIRKLEELSQIESNINVQLQLMCSFVKLGVKSLEEIESKVSKELNQQQELSKEFELLYEMVILTKGKEKWVKSLKELEKKKKLDNIDKLYLNNLDVSLALLEEG